MWQTQAKQSLISNCATFTLAMSWNRSSMLREQECASGCAVRAVETFAMWVICAGDIRATSECVVPMSAIHIHWLLKGSSWTENRNNRAVTPQEEMKEWWRGRAWSYQKSYKRSWDGRDKEEEGQKEGPACGQASLHEDKVEEISEGKGRGLVGPRREMGIWGSLSHHETKQGMERNEDQFICNGTLFLCRARCQLLATSAVWEVPKRKVSVMNCGIPSWREPLSYRVMPVPQGTHFSVVQHCSSEELVTKIKKR